MRSRGIEVLEFIKMYSEANPATFDNKYLLLEASRMELMGSKQAGMFYQKSIEAARANKFPHVSWHLLFTMCVMPFRA